jgi:hypothetical protein
MLAVERSTALYPARVDASIDGQPHEVEEHRPHVGKKKEEHASDRCRTCAERRHAKPKPHRGRVLRAAMPASDAFSARYGVFVLPKVQFCNPLTLRWPIAFFDGLQHQPDAALLVP